MKQIFVSVGVLALLAQIGWAQDIVLKSTFQGDCSSYARSYAFYPKIDLNDDGISEIPAGSPVQPYSFYLNTSTFQKFYPPINATFTYPQSDNGPWVAMMRRPGLAEWVILNNHISTWAIHDMETNDLLCPVAWGSCLYVFDYDQDGLDDVISIPYSGEVSVYGIATGNPPISPPQDLNIQKSGENYIITWNSVPSATAYRVLWSSSIDGTSFTRIGYTTATNFVHHNRAAEPMGFYRVMSEDNGTGVVRMVGQTTGVPK